MTAFISRRHLLTGAMFGAGGMLLLGAPAVRGALQAAPPTKLTMHRSPGCGCCLKWVAAGREAGFDIVVINSPDIVSFKQAQGVPTKLYSCHTTLAGKYVLEGHVPFQAIRKLLASKPDIRGIAVPGMPLGSPGMEVPSGEKQPFQVVGFDAEGTITVFG